ncbi:MAG: hypothetical protein F4X51_15860 [Gemmatimonadetes bacterium]|nr:hypothetical protein [Gemmatimonadota bacterium]
MHFEVLVEDQSGKHALDILIPKIIGSEHSFKVRAYRGIGHIPSNLTSNVGVSSHLLLNALPKMLRGYGKTFAGYPENYPAAVIVVCDLDDRCLKVFRQDLFRVLGACNPRPEARFCIAIEEGEAWLLGDIPAIKTAYPNARDNVLNGYTNDAICGTWELLADAISQGGVTGLKKRGWRAVGREKSIWATNIASNMDVKNNKSPSFRYFRQKIQELIEYSDARA